MRVQKEFIEYEAKLNEKNKSKQDYAGQMTEKLYNLRAERYELAETTAKSSTDGLLRAEGRLVRKFTTLPS